MTVSPGKGLGNAPMYLAGFLLCVGLSSPFVSESVANRSLAQMRAGHAGASDPMCGANCRLSMIPQDGDVARPAAAPGAKPKRETGEASEVKERVAPDGERTKTVTFKNLLIDKLYPSMSGPMKEHRVLLGDQAEQGLWVTSYRAEVLDGKSGEASQEFMCHTNLDLVGMPNTEASHFQKQQLSIAQGQKEVNFPEGFALRFFNDPLVEIRLAVMVLNNNEPKIHRLLDFKTTLKYFTDEGAARRKLTPLFQTGVCLFPLIDAAAARPGEPVARTANEREVSHGPDGRARTGHWWVPPGRQVLRDDVTALLNLKQDTTVHYMWMHVHPFAESVELRDVTANQSVWKGAVVNDPNKNHAAVVSTESFSSVEGKPLYKDHRYEFVSTYENPTHHDIDAMAALWIYCRSHQ